MCEYSIVIPSGSIDFISLDIITGAIVVVSCFARCVLAPESAIAGILLLGELGWVPIQFIKILLGILISNVLIIFPNHHLHNFSFSRSLLKVVLFLMSRLLA